LDLDDRIITDTGSMVAKYDLIIKLALSGKPFEELVTVDHEDIFRYHYNNKSISTAKKWVDDHTTVGPSLDTFDWNIPDAYKKIDIVEYCLQKMDAKGIQGDNYINRLASELLLVEDKQMTDFIRCLIYIIDTMREHNIVWGLGRGSSCASLIMFIIGINKVDPILYDIGMEEFYK